MFNNHREGYSFPKAALAAAFAVRLEKSYLKIIFRGYIL